MTTVEVGLTGELCHIRAPALRRDLEDAIATGAQRVVIDLAGVSMLAAAGLTELARASNALHAEGRTLVLRRPAGLVRRVIEITGFAGLLDEKALAPTH